MTITSERLQEKAQDQYGDLDMKEMTSRERVSTAFNFGEPDRVPICFGGQIASGIAESLPNGLVCSKLYEYLEIIDAEPIRDFRYTKHC